MNAIDVTCLCLGLANLACAVIVPGWQPKLVSLVVGVYCVAVSLA